MLNLIFAGIILLTIIILSFSLKLSADERVILTVGVWLGFLLASQLMAGFVKIGTDGERNYDKEAKALIAECEKSLPRDQNCAIEMKATVE